MEDSHPTVILRGCLMSLQSGGLQRCTCPAPGTGAGGSVPRAHGCSQARSERSLVGSSRAALIRSGAQVPGYGGAAECCWKRPGSLSSYRLWSKSKSHEPRTENEQGQASRNRQGKEHIVWLPTLHCSHGYQTVTKLCDTTSVRGAASKPCIWRYFV